MEFDTVLSIPEIVASSNVAELLSNDDLNSLGMTVVEHYRKDRTSRQEWEERTSESLKLALQVVEQKSFPWANASNVKFPLITIAALQYHSRSYPVLINTPNLVKCTGDEVVGDKISKHMSYQILEESDEWENEMDLVLITQPIVGCAFKKTYRDPVTEKIISENILAKDLVVPYLTKSFDTCNRVSHVIYLTNNDIHSREVSGLYLKEDLSTYNPSYSSELSVVQDERQGVTGNIERFDNIYEVVEQHLYLDLDHDGYEEPYIVVVDIESRKVLRLVARYNIDNITYNSKGVVLDIQPEQYFTKYPFIPSPDGGFYDLGFGSLLGPLNESINTILNQLIDAGTLANTAGGFLSKGVKLRSGNYGFSPMEWKQVDSTGDDLRKGIVPLPVREPSQVLFMLLSLLINYGERIGGAVDIMTGQNPGQNTPAETTRTMTEQGMKIFSGIFKRTYRSLKSEFRKIFRLNQLYFEGPIKLGQTVITGDDYLEAKINHIHPAADPNMITDNQRILQGQMIQSRANPGTGYNMREVELAILRTWHIPEETIAKILPDPKGKDAPPPFVPPKIQEAQIKIQGKLQEVQLKIKLEVAKLQMESQLNQAKIEQLRADAAMKLELADHEEARVQIAAIDSQIGVAKIQQEHIFRTLEMLQSMNQGDQENDTGG